MTETAKSFASPAEAIDRLRRERPHARAFLDPFVGLLLARPPLVRALLASGDGVLAPPADPARLGLGACLEPRDAMPLRPQALRAAFKALQPILTHAFREARSDLMVLGEAASFDPALLSQAASDMLADRHEAMRRMAGSLGVAPQVLGFWCVQLLTPLAMARGRKLAGHVEGMPWNRGYCPVCGSWPGYSRKERAGSRMTCSFCATSWLFTRRECPYCEASGVSGQVYAVPGFGGERVVVCGRCDHYLGELDADAFAGCDPEAVALVLSPIELLARQHGHVPATMDWRQMVWV